MIDAHQLCNAFDPFPDLRLLYASCRRAQRTAARLGIPYVDLADFPINHDLFRAIPVDLMFRYNFVPWKEENGRLVVVISDPSDVLMVDELEILLGRPVSVCVGSKSAP